MRVHRILLCLATLIAARVATAGTLIPLNSGMQMTC